MDLNNNQISIVTHEQIIPNIELLPTFSSPAIETFIHRIPNLSKHFLYLNDDIFLGAPLYPDDLYTQSEGVQIYQAWLVPECAEDCPWTYIGDGACDNHCNIKACQFDGGDCVEEIIASKAKKVYDKIHKKQITDKVSKQKLSITHFPKLVAQLAKTRQITKHNFKDIIQEQTAQNISNLKDVVANFNKHIQKRAHQTQRKSKPSNTTNTIKDVYSQSLINTNMLLNRHYGFKSRNVMAHVGLLLDKTIIDDMQQKFGADIQRTLANRFRSSADLQFSFAYYNFLMSETQETLSVANIFDEFDTDKSMTWSDREIRTFLSRTFPLPLDFSALKFFESVIRNCSNLMNWDSAAIQYTTLIYERYSDSNLVGLCCKFMFKINKNLSLF